jgi:hypothetical protein
MNDWIRLIELIYDLETPSHDAWLTKLTATIAPAMSTSKHAVGGISHLEGSLLQMFASSEDATAYAAHSHAPDSIDPGIIVVCFESAPWRYLLARRNAPVARLLTERERSVFSLRPAARREADGSSATTGPTSRLGGYFMRARASNAF